MAENNINIEIRNDFNQIFGIISYHRQRVSKTIDDESLRMIWEVGGYISHKLKKCRMGSRYCTPTLRVYKNARSNHQRMELSYDI